MQTDWLQYFHHYTIFTNLYLVKRAVAEQEYDICSQWIFSYV